MLMRLFWIGFVILLASCVSAPSKLAETTESRVRIGLQLTPSDLGESIALQQHLLIHRNGKTDELDVALEVDSTELHLVGLAFGQRILSMQYDGKNLTTWRHAMLPSQVREEDILEDIQLTLWPIGAIRHALPPGWTIEDKGMERLLRLGDTIICEITYSSMPRWSGTVKLVNLRYHYDLTIQSLLN